MKKRARLFGLALKSKANILEADPRAQLNFASRGRNFGDAAKAGRVHEAVRRAEVGVVERVEELRACFEASLLRHR